MVFSDAIILLRYPLSQPVRLPTPPEGEPRGASVPVAKLQFSHLMGYALRDLATFTVEWRKAGVESSFCFLDEIPRIMV